MVGEQRERKRRRKLIAPTIGETIDQLRKALRDYIEATYHISHPALVAERRKMLDQTGVIFQRPYLESTPRYMFGDPFDQLGLDPAVTELFGLLSKESKEQPVLIHDPPYHHQAESIRKSLVERKNLVVMTGTGSGKTECFLLPILGKLAIEAKNRRSSFSDFAAVRAIILYPMNALVNDQLGRLRLLFGDERVVSKFMEWSGRPARFARYTSRTLYPGVRTNEKDRDRLKPIEKYYVENLMAALGDESPEKANAEKLVSELRKRGKWPAKPDLIEWYFGPGKREKGGRWKDASGNFQRCIALPNDPELFTRHEVQNSPPDVLITNYSMLEYMLMRPLERSIFDDTLVWLKENPDETLLLVIDEAHLYRGASGAEVALLIRRLRTRLGIPPERLQVICTSASFHDQVYAAKFGSQLSGTDLSNFETIPGNLRLRNPASQGNSRDAEVLASIDLARFYECESPDDRLVPIAPFLEYRGVEPPWNLEMSLYRALEDFPPMSHLVNISMQEALPVEDLGTEVFKDVSVSTADRAVTALLALGSLARPEPAAPSLLPCRVHSFFRGLAGLWACMDPDCSALEGAGGARPCGKLYSQPQDKCDCGARVLEFFTCRHCGTAYGRAYTNDTIEPGFLWSEAGGAFHTHSGYIGELEPLDLLLEKPPLDSNVESAGYDLVTGRLNSRGKPGPRTRNVFLRPNRIDQDAEAKNCGRGQFSKCALCEQGARFGRSSVQDHQTKGDEPFQVLVTAQIQVQPPGPQKATPLAPLRGRKVLVFSDSRQTAARLAPNLQTYSLRDAMRPLIVTGFSHLQEFPNIVEHLSLEDLYLAVLIAAKKLGVRLRPELKVGESFHEQTTMENSVESKDLDDPSKLLFLLTKFRSAAPPNSLIQSMSNCITNRYLGLEPLALGSIVESYEHREFHSSLPDLPGVAEGAEQKVALGRAWLRCWLKPGFWLNHMPAPWYLGRVEGGVRVAGRQGKFAAFEKFVGDKTAKKAFNRQWLPLLLNAFTEKMGTLYRLKGSEISLEVGGSWLYCQSCRTTQRAYGAGRKCINCARDTAVEIDPDNDEVFRARKAYYRRDTIAALSTPPKAPIALIASEHTAQLNTAQAHEVFSIAEKNELLFQDVDLGSDSTGQELPAIDVLSSTTTMEVGIDIGTLSGVSLRNMPPARANYQQRAGRAGRRGTAVATVTAFGSADSHDEHYFSHPDQMIRGEVEDPVPTLDNKEIARRHLIAYLLQRYHQERLPAIPLENEPQLFAVLGSVEDFKNPAKTLNIHDMISWLETNQDRLRTDVDGWLPTELSLEDRASLLGELTLRTVDEIARAIDYTSGTDYVAPETPQPEDDGEATTSLEVGEEEGEEQPGRDPASQNLLDRLLYRGVLPRYAFPTDVATFYVFDEELSTSFRPRFLFTPSQGLSAALSQYAPGKSLWMANKLWTSGAIYSPMQSERYAAWGERRYYYECNVCRFAMTKEQSEGVKGETLDCPACVSGSLGPAATWLRPPGFAHPVGVEVGTSPDDQPARSYATRAKLTAPTPNEADSWDRLNDRVRVHHTRQHLLVTNRGPRQEGYTYCTICGRIEPTAVPKGIVAEGHQKPYPDDEPICTGNRTARGIVLGTDFITDVLLISVRVSPPLVLQPGLLVTDVAMRTISEALTKAACARLGLEPNELQAEHRPALTEDGQIGREAEVYIYDTLPGGAGFSRRAGELGLTVFEDALDILEHCPNNCDRSCYRCLRSYKNKFEHHLLDRHIGLSLLRFVLTGDTPSLEKARLESSTDTLFEDLIRQGLEGVTIERNQCVDVPGFGEVNAPIRIVTSEQESFIVALHSPLTPDHTESELDDLAQFGVGTPVVVIDEFLVRRNLPKATELILEQIA